MVNISSLSIDPLQKRIEYVLPQQRRIHAANSTERPCPGVAVSVQVQELIDAVAGMHEKREPLLKNAGGNFDWWLFVCVQPFKLQGKRCPAVRRKPPYVFQSIKGYLCLDTGLQINDYSVIVGIDSIGTH